LVWQAGKKGAKKPAGYFVQGGKGLPFELVNPAGKEINNPNATSSGELLLASEPQGKTKKKVNREGPGCKKSANCPNSKRKTRDSNRQKRDLRQYRALGKGKIYILSVLTMHRLVE